MHSVRVAAAIVALGLLPAVEAWAGQVTLTTEPAEVEVFQGTTRLGVTGADGLTVELPAGPVVLAFVKPGFKRVERRVLVGESPLALTVKLAADEPAAKAARPAPAPRPAEAPKAGDRVRVSVPRANVRTTPSRDGEILTTLGSGTVLEVTDVEGEWAAVVVPADEKSPRREGFISLSVVRAETAAEAAAAAADRRPAAEPAPAASPAPRPTEAEPGPPETAERPAAPAPAREATLQRRQPAARTTRATGNPQEKGDKEVLAFANLLGFRSEGGSFGNGMVFFNLGKFITDRTEIGGGPTVNLSAGGGDTTLSLGANAFYRYFLDNKGGQWFPYVGADIYVNDVTGSATGNDLPGVETPGLLDRTYFQVIGGARNYLTEKLALELKASIGFAIGQPTSAQLFQGTLGFSYVF